MPSHVKETEGAVLHVLGEGLRVQKLTLPKLLHGQILVKVLFSGVCRSQLMEVKGLRGEDRWLPHLLGHEGSGVVLEVGRGVTKVRPGDEVILGWVKGEGLDAPGARYTSGGQIINSGAVTTFSRHTIVAENRVVKKPEEMAADIAVLFGCAMPTGAGIVLNELRPATGSTGVVLGLGGIGLAAVMALRAFSCSRVIAIDISDDKLGLARELGATDVFNPRCGDTVQAVRRLIPEGVDFCVESAGSAATIEQGFAMIRTGGGRLVFASHPPEGEQIQLSPHALISGKQISGSWGGATHPDSDVPQFFRLLQAGGAPLRRLIPRRYGLEHINQALADLEAGEVFRPLIDMDH